MPGLTDMEELLSRVKTPTLAGYLREALTCYGAGAYRACVVMSFIAVFEDLREKTKTLAKLNASAKKVSAAIEKLAESQKPFENQLVEQLQSATLITELQGQRLKQIITHRNKAAHPSGIAASAEEARFVFFECIERFLSQPVLSTTHLVDDIKGRLPNSNFFPSHMVDEIGIVARHETEMLHSTAYAHLLHLLVENVVSADETVSHNAKFFITGLIHADQNAWRAHVQKHLIQAKSSDPSYQEPIVTAIGQDPSLLDGCSGAVLSRIAAMLQKAVTEQVDPRAIAHPMNVLRKMISGIPDADLFPRFDGFLDAVIHKYWRESKFLPSVKDSPAALAKAMEHLLSKCGSTDFNTANDAASTVRSNDSALASILEARDAYRLLSAIHYAATVGAWRSLEAEADRFSALPKLAAMAAEHANSGTDLEPDTKGGDAEAFVDDYLPLTL